MRIRFEFLWHCSCRGWRCFCSFSFRLSICLSFNSWISIRTIIFFYIIASFSYNNGIDIPRYISGIVKIVFYIGVRFIFNNFKEFSVFDNIKWFCFAGIIFLMDALNKIIETVKTIDLIPTFFTNILFLWSTDLMNK